MLSGCKTIFHVGNGSFDRYDSDVLSTVINLNEISIAFNDKLRELALFLMAPCTVTDFEAGILITALLITVNVQAFILAETK